MTTSELLRNYQEIRARLREPPNRVKDYGIDLKRKKITPPVIKTLEPVVITINATIPEPRKEATPERRVFVHEIVKVVARHYKIGIKDIMEGTRRANIVLPRQICSYLSVIITGATLPAIGRAMGLDHTTVMHGRNKISYRAMMEPEFNETLEQLKREIVG